MRYVIYLLWRFNLIALHWHQDLDDINGGYDFVSTTRKGSWMAGTTKEYQFYGTKRFDPADYTNPPQWVGRYNFRFNHKGACGYTASLR